MKLFKYSINDLQLNLLQFKNISKNDQFNCIPNKIMDQISRQKIDFLEQLPLEKRDQVINYTSILYFY
jgi:hypothetical protein